MDTNTTTQSDDLAYLRDPETAFYLRDEVHAPDQHSRRSQEPQPLAGDSHASTPAQEGQPVVSDIDYIRNPDVAFFVPPAAGPRATAETSSPPRRASATEPSVSFVSEQPPGLVEGNEGKGRQRRERYWRRVWRAGADSAASATGEGEGEMRTGPREGKEEERCESSGSSGEECQLGITVPTACFVALWAVGAAAVADGLLRS